MARKRINKNLVTVLVLVGLGLVLMVFLVVLSQFRDPLPFVEKAQSLIAAARELDKAIAAEVSQIADPQEAYERQKALQEEKSEPAWQKAMKTLSEAQTYANRKRNKELDQQIALQQLEIYEERGMFKEQQGMWNYLLKRNPDLYDIQLKQATYFQQLGENLAFNVWPNVKTEADKLISINEKQQGTKPDGYLLKAQALLRMVEVQTEEKPDEALQQAEALLETCRAHAGDRPLWYRLRGQLELLRGKDVLEAAQQEYIQRAGDYFQAAINAMPDNTKVYINHYRYYRLILLQRQLLQASRSQSAQAAIEGYQQQANMVLGDLDQSIARFPEEPEFLIIKAEVLSQGLYPWRRLDERIALMEKACQAESADVIWSVQLASLYEQRDQYPCLGETNLRQAYDLLGKALRHPDLLREDGPRQLLVGMVRLQQALPLMVKVSVRLAQVAGDKAAQEQYLATAQDAAKQLQDKFPENNFLVLLARGRVALAQGEREEGLKYLEQADRLAGAAGERNPDVKVELFSALRGTANHGLALQYGLEAVRYGNATERLYFDYAEALLQRPGPGQLQLLEQVMRNIEDQFGERVSTQQRYLRLQAEWRIRKGDFDGAREYMAKLTEKDFELQLLWAQAQPTPEERVAKLDELRREHPANPVIVAGLVDYYVKQASGASGASGAGMLAQARTVVKDALAKEPDNVSFLRQQRLLDEANPLDIRPERLQEIALESLESIEDPFERHRRLGSYYQQMSGLSRVANDSVAAEEQAAKAQEHLQAALDLQPENIDVMMNLFALNLAQGNENRNEAILSKVRNLDAVEALRFEAVDAIEDQKWDEAANRLERYLQERPISSAAHLALSQTYASLNRYAEALEQAQIAVRQDDMNAAAHRQTGLLLHQQYQQDGLESLTLLQLQTIMQTVDTAVRLAPQDITCQQLKVFYFPRFIQRYAEQVQGMDHGSPNYPAELQRVKDLRNDAIETARRLTAGDPKDPSRRALMASLYAQLAKSGDADLAKDYLRQAEETYKTALAELNYPQVLLESYRAFLVEQGRVDDAVAMLEKLSKEGEGDEEAQWQIRLELAQTYIGSGNLEQAQTELQTMLAERPSDHSALVMMGDVHRIAGNHGAAVETYQKAREIEDSEALSVRWVETIMQAGDLERAQAGVQEIRKTYPNYQRLNLLEANVAILNADYDEAIRLAELTLQANKDDAVAMLLLGRAQFYAAKYDNALETFQRLRREVGAVGTTGQLDLARTLWMLRRRDEALTEVRSVVDKESQPEARRMLITMLQSLKRWSELERYYTELIQAYPEDIPLRLQLANVILSQGDDAFANKQERQAKELYQRGLKQLVEAAAMSKSLERNQADAISTLLEATLRFKDYEGALRVAEENLTGEEVDALWWGYKATALSQLGRQEEALTFFEKSLDRVKDKPALQNRLLEFLPRMKDTAGLIAWSRNRLEQQPDWMGLRLALADLYHQQQDNEAWVATLEDARGRTDNPNGQAFIDRRLATAYLVSGKTDRAIETFRSLVKVQPKNVDVLNNLAYLLLDQKKDFEEALQLAEKAYTLSPTQSTVMDTYALALLESKDYTKAEWMLRRAIQQLQRDDQPVTPEYYFHLGLALKGQGQKGAAAEQFEAALQGLRDGLLSVGDAEALRQQITEALND